MSPNVIKISGTGICGDAVLTGSEESLLVWNGSYPPEWIETSRPDPTREAEKASVQTILAVNKTVDLMSEQPPSPEAWAAMRTLLQTQIAQIVEARLGETKHGKVLYSD